jgi:hypothetical protein
MRATLSAVGATASLLGADEVVEVPGADAEWRWLLSPKWEGEIPVTVTLNAVVMSQGQEMPFPLRTFEAALNVTVAPSTRFTSFLSANWWWLGLLGLAPVMAWAMVRRKRHRRRRRRRPSAPLQS